MKLQREIKFRAWDVTKRQNGGMLYSDDYPDLGCFWTLAHGQLTENRSNPIMQFTVLKDKNGKEIYEGDIVKYTFMQTVPTNGSFNAPVFFHEGCFAIGTVNNEPLTLREAIKISNKADGLEIIGNIYEHQELLNQPSL